MVTGAAASIDVEGGRVVYASPSPTMHRLLSPLVLVVLFVVVAGCADPADRLVGTWQPATASAQPGDADMRYTFFADGQARIVARPPIGPPQTYDARFSLSGDTLLTLSDKQGAERFRLALRDDTLRLESPVTGRRTVLVRLRTAGG